MGGDIWMGELSHKTRNVLCLVCLSGELMWENESKHTEWYQVDFYTAGATALHS